MPVHCSATGSTLAVPVPLRLSVSVTVLHGVSLPVPLVTVPVTGTPVATPLQVGPLAVGCTLAGLGTRPTVSCHLRLAPGRAGLFDSESCQCRLSGTGTGMPNKTTCAVSNNLKGIAMCTRSGQATRNIYFLYSSSGESMGLIVLLTAVTGSAG